MKGWTKRSPRRLDFNHEALAGIPLNDKAPPPDDSISWKLWRSCQEIAQEALDTAYIQGIKEGNLDPNNYGRYSLQDAVYCHYGQDNYLALETRARERGYPALAAFARARFDSYRTYTAEIFEAWYIKNVNAISLGKAAQTYRDFEHRIATEWEPIYGIIAMIPCDQLWAYLATELRSNAGPKNLYRFWISENADWGAAFRLDNFIDDWFAGHPGVYDWKLALFIFQSCMTCEVNFFRSACSQDLLPMPMRNAGQGC